MIKHTHDIIESVYDDGSTKKRVVAIDDVDPPIDPPVEPPQGVEPTYTANDGDDASDGINPATPVKAFERTRQVLYRIGKADPDSVLAVMLRRGSTFPAFGMLRGHEPETTGGELSWKIVVLKGTADQYMVVGGYGDGSRPVVENEAADAAFMMWGDGSLTHRYVEINGVEVRGGFLIHNLSVAEGLRVIDCIGQSANVVSMPLGNTARFADATIRDTVIRDCTTPQNHRSGVFVSRCDGLVIEDSVFDRNGWLAPSPDTPDDELVVSIYNHGLYITSSCTGVKFSRNVCTFNSGAGVQLRGGGNVTGNFIAWNGRTGMDWGLVNGSSTGMGGKTGEVSGNLIFDSGAGFGLGVSNIASGRIHNNTLVHVRGNNSPLLLRADHGENTRGGERVGINELIVENNLIVGNLVLEGDGWGKLGGAGVLIRGNRITGQIIRGADFADPLGKVVIEDEAGQTNHADPGITEPERTPELVEAITSQTLAAADLIERYGVAA